MLNKRIFFFVILSIILIIGLSMVTASDNPNNTTINSIDSNQHTIETNVDKHISDDNIQSSKTDNMLKDDISSKNILKEDKNIKTSRKIVITNETFNTYFTDTYLNENVSVGDVLDFQGQFIGDNYSMCINKPVNITSSTKDAYIYLNTSANDWFGGDEVSAFTIVKSGAYTNVSYISFFNSQVFVKNSHHIIFNNISAVVDGSTTGRGVGQTSIRENSSFVIVENSTFSTKDQWGDCGLVLAWANNCTVRYNTLIGIGEVGNLFYLTTFNVDGNLPRDEEGRLDYNLINVNNTFENNLLIGPDHPQAMCYVICLSGTNNRIVNNTILNYTGYGINVQAYSFDYDMRTLIANNTLIGCNFFMPNGSTVVNNTVTGNFSIGSRSIVENNTLTNLKIIYDDTKVSNLNVENIYLTSGKNNITIENCNITGNISFRSSSISELPSNITIRNNNIGGYILINGSKNISIYNNTIAKQILFSGRNNGNNNISIYNNSIITDEEYTIMVNKRVPTLNISDNYLLTDNATGNDTIYINTINENTTVKNDMVHYILNDSNYLRFFNADGTIRDDILKDNITLEVNSNMKNRKFIFTNGSVNFTNPKKYNLTNCSIEVKENSDLSLNNIKVNNITYELTDSNYNKYFNNEGFLGIDVSNNNVTLLVAGNMKNKKFVFTQGKVKFANAARYTLTSCNIHIKENANVSLTNIKVDKVTYDLTDSNYNMFFNNDGFLKVNTSSGDVGFIICSNMKNKKFVFANGTYELNNTKSYTLTNATILVKADAKLSLNNIQVDNITYELTDSNYHNFFTSDAHAIKEVITGNVTLILADNIKNKDFIFDDAKINFTNPKNYTIANTTIKITSKAQVTLDGLNIKNTNKNTGNVIEVSSRNNIIKNTNIILNGADKVIGLNITNADNTTITNINVNITASDITAVQLDNVSHVTIENSIYTLKASNITAISLNSDKINNVKNININNITVDIQEANDSTLISLDKVTDVNITNSELISNKGRAVTINNSRNILVDNNYINTTSDYTVEVVNSNNTNVTNNGLYANSQEGDASVEVINSNASVHDNNMLNSLVRITGSLTIFKPSNIQVKVTDLKGNSINYGSIDLLINNKNYPVLFENGTATLTYTPQNMDDVEVTAVYTSPNKLQITNSTSLKVRMINTKINLTSATSLVNQQVTLNATIKDAMNNNVTNGVISFTDDTGKILAKYNLTNGFASVTVNYSKDGVYNITANYANSSMYKASTAKSSVTVNQVNIDITGSLVALTPGNITVKVTNQNKSAVTVGSLTVMVNNKKQSVSFKNGAAVIAYTPQSTSKVNVSVVYTTPDKFVVGKNSSLGVSMVGTKASLTSKVVVVNQGVLLNVTVIDVLGNPVKDGIVTFTDASGKVLGGSKVSGGIAKLNMSYSKVGVYNITATYGNSSMYKASTAKSSVTVNQVNIDITGSLVALTPGNITVKVTNQNKSAVTVGSLTVMVNNKKQSVSFKNGAAVIAYTPQSTSKVNVSVVYTTPDKFAVGKNSSLGVSMVGTKASLTSKVVVVNQGVLLNVTVIDVLGNPVKDGIVTFTDGSGKVLGGSKVSGGIAKLNVSYSKVGVYNITASYANSSMYKASSAKASVTVNQVNIDITGSLVALTPGNITVKITNQNKAAITTGSLIVMINNKKQSVSFKNGSTVIAYTPQNANKVNVSAVYTTPDKFDVGKTASLNVAKIKTKLTITSNNSSPRVNQKVKLTFALQDAMKNKVTSQKITVTVNNKNYTLTTNSQSQATLEYTLNKNYKNVTIKAQYAGNTVYLASNNNLTLNRTYKLDMELLTGSFDTKPGDTVKLIAHIQDNHVDIDGGQLVFKLNGLSLKDDKNNAVVVNIKNGLAVLEYKIQDTLGARVHNLTAVYASNTYGRVELSTPMTINKFYTHIDVNPVYTTSNTIQVKAQVADQNNHALNKQISVCIKLNGKNYVFNTTNGTINYKFTQSLKDGYYDLGIIAGENGKYYSCVGIMALIKTTTPIKVNYTNNALNTKTSTKSGDTKTSNIMSILTGSSIVKPGDRLKLIAHLAEDGVDITGGQLVFKLNGLSLKDDDGNAVVVNIKDGLGILDYKIPDTLGARVHNLTAVYVSKKYGRVELSTSLTMNKLNTHITAEPTYINSDTSIVRAQIFDDNYQLINRQTTVVIKVDGKSYTTNSTDGILRYTLPIKLSKGLHQVTVIVGENGKYLSSRSNTVLIKT